MIICSNCGATNSESDGRFCRKCGALLPVSSRPPRIRINTTRQKEKEKSQEKEASQTPQRPRSDNEPQRRPSSGIRPVDPQVRFFAPTENPEKSKSSAPSTLQQIPQGGTQAQQEKTRNIDENQLSSIPQGENEVEENSIEEQQEIRREMLQEITPQPFSGSIISQRGVYGPPRQEQQQQKQEPPSNQEEKRDLSAIPTVQQLPPQRGSESQPSKPEKSEQKEKKNDVQQKTQNIPQARPRPSIQSIPASRAATERASESIDAIIKRNRLQNDMSEVLSVLSSKLKIPKQEKSEKKGKDGEKKEEVKLPPTSMNEILKNLLNIDYYIEASAIIKTDGTILASAISNRISDSLFATVGQNLSMIGSDIVEGLSAGKLTSISVRGTEGILDLAPIDHSNRTIKDMILIIFSTPRVKSGIINIATSMIRKEIKDYLGVAS